MAKKKNKQHDPKVREADKDARQDAVTANPPAEEVAAEQQDGDAATAGEQADNDCQDKLMRLAAEFENYKKRMARERETYLKYAEENILKELLPSVDNLERALDHEPGSEIGRAHV